MSEKYEAFRAKYPVFYYHDFEIVESEREIGVTFDFEIEGLSHFNPAFSLQKPAGKENVGFLALFRKAAFSLGMIELISYWKQTCSPAVIVECGTLDANQISWWKKLYYNGLGEFFYVNGIEADPDTFMRLTATGEAIEGQSDHTRYHGNMIPVGGGKDSFVTLDLLKDSKEDNHAFIINRIKSAVHSAEAAGYTGDKLIIAERSLDPRMLDFNKQGYLNGHTPFSALAAFASLLTAVVYEKQYICLSNEDSANESTVKGSKVNHQYSKTFEFEQDFSWYVDTYLTKEIHYFSMLRPISELQITGIFSKPKPYHKVFRSCNVGQKEEKWCGHCAKCLFVAVMLSAYLDDEELHGIFGKDMLNDMELEELFEQLTGILDNKPFECVGTREEVNTAVAMSIRRHEAEGKTLPLLYEKYKNSSYYEFYKNRCVDMTAWNDQNLLPEEFAAILRKRLQETEI